VTRRLGATKLLGAARLSGGASQETYRLDTERADGSRLSYALRRAPGGRASERSAGKPGLEAEARLMQAAREAGIPEPEIHWVLREDDALGVGFVMQWLEGETLGSRIVRSAELASVRPKLARQCGEILGRIHSLDLETTGIGQLLDPMTPAEFVEQTYANYLALDTPQPMIDYAAAWLRQHLPRNPRIALVHNDFRNGNLMVGPEGVRAVLDWEIAHLGDPVRDLGWMCVNSWRFGRSDLVVGGFGHIEDLLQGYRATSGVEVDPEHLKFWIVFGSFWWSIGCLGMAKHYRSGPDRSVERAAIGRRTTECQIDLVNLLIPGPVTLVGDPLAIDELAERSADTEMPRIDELVQASVTYLRTEVLNHTQGRTQFLSRVTANALDVVRRDLLLGPEHRRREGERLRELLGQHAPRDQEAVQQAPLAELRQRLVDALRSPPTIPDNASLQEHLRQTVANQVAIDQPRYSGFADLLSSSENGTSTTA
jgi:aminoglycoside phosphotransferase (APT) family kinase protein